MKDKLKIKFLENLCYFAVSVSCVLKTVGDVGLFFIETCSSKNNSVADFHRTEDIDVKLNKRYKNGTKNYIKYYIENLIKFGEVF